MKTCHDKVTNSKMYKIKWDRIFDIVRVIYISGLHIRSFTIVVYELRTHSRTHIYTHMRVHTDTHTFILINFCCGRQCRHKISFNERNYPELYRLLVSILIINSRIFGKLLFAIYKKVYYTQTTRVLTHNVSRAIK